MIIMTSLYVALVLVLVYVSYCDVRYRIIPNGASLAILVGFLQSESCIQFRSPIGFYME